jgi:hypothetical protein
MWMEWTIPIQKLELSKIVPGSLQTSGKALTPLEYKDGPFALKHLNILLPPLCIREYDSTTGKLSLFLPEQSPILQKLLALQESLLLLVYQHQKSWFSDSNRTKEQMQNFFQPFVEGTNLQLYCPLQSNDKKYFFSLWKNGCWSRLTTPGVLQKGDVLRVALRLQGISYQTNVISGAWTGRFRIQHRIICMYHCGSQKSS